MTAYWILLLLTAFFAYNIGSLDTMVLASNFVFHKRLSRLGTGNLWLSNFRRIYGFKGFLLYGLVEIIKDIIPILFGALMLSFKGHADAGRTFAAFCMVLGSLFPIFYGFKGKRSAIALVVAGFAMESTVGIAAADAYRRSPADFELHCDNDIMALARRAKLVTMGIEPVIGYYMARRAEMQNIRIIYSGIATGQPEETITGRLRELYG